MTSDFNWHHAVNLTLTFDFFENQICCRARDHDAQNLLVLVIAASEKLVIMVERIFRLRGVMKGGYSCILKRL